jgi:hypothetical protein
LGGASGTVGFVGDVGCGFCAIAGAAARISAVIERARNILEFPLLCVGMPDAVAFPNASARVTFLDCQWNATCYAGSRNASEQPQPSGLEHWGLGDCLLRYDKKSVDVPWLLAYMRRRVTSPHRDAFLL